MKSIELYVSHVSGMHGGSSEMPDLFRLNDELAAAVVTWNESAGDHTGTWPIPVDALDDEDLDDDERDEGSAPLHGHLSVVSRWDLAIIDPDAVIAAGREAHQRNRPDENKRDTRAAVHDVSSALYAITHENGEPWYSIDGIDVIHGERIYVQPDEPLQTPDAPPEPGDNSFLTRRPARWHMAKAGTRAAKNRQVQMFDFGSNARLVPLACH